MSIVNVLASEISEYQHIMVVEDERGPQLVLDGHFQTYLPNREYYDMLLCCNPGTLDTVVYGGGDLTGVPVLYSKISRSHDWRICEIDKTVVDMCAPYSPLTRDKWEEHMVYADALELLDLGELRTGHSIIDLLGMHRVNELSDKCAGDEFVNKIAENSQYLISAFVGGGTQGMIMAEFLRREWNRHGFCYSAIMVNDLCEVLMTVGRAALRIPSMFEKYVVRYRTIPKTGEVFDLSFNDRLIIVQEAM